MELSIDGGWSKLDVSIVIPAYNEEYGLGPLAAQINEVMLDNEVQWKVIVVDDGSTDGTAEVARRAGVTLLQHQYNRGYGAALKTGIRHANSGIIVMVDSDGTYPIASIPQLLATFQESQCDMVVGARIGPRVAIPLIRRPARWALTRLAEFITQQPIPDLNSGLRVFSRDAILQFIDLLPDGFSFTTTITLAMLSNGHLVSYVPINYHPRVGRSKIRPVHDTISFVYLVLRIALFFAPLKIFVPLAGLLLCAGISWGLFSKFVLGQFADVSTSIIMTSALETMLLGLLAELINNRSMNVYRK